MQGAAAIDSRHLEAKITNKRTDSLTDVFPSDAILVVKGGLGLLPTVGGDGFIGIMGAEVSGLMMRPAGARSNVSVVAERCDAADHRSRVRRPAFPRQVRRLPQQVA